jgi:adenylosuccinate synthase
MITGCDSNHTGSDLLDDPRTLVAENDRARKGNIPAHHAEVALTQAAGLHPDYHLALGRRTHVHVVDELVLLTIEDNGSHLGTSLHSQERGVATGRERRTLPRTPIGGSVPLG